MKLFKKKENVKVYEPKKEKIQRIQQQVAIMNHAIILA